MPDYTTGVSGDVSGLDSNLTRIIIDAQKAWATLHNINPTLADSIKAKFRADGYKYNAGLQALISQAPPALQHPLYAYYSNRAAVRQSISAAFGKAFSGLADNLATAAGTAGKAPVALAKGLSSLTLASFLGMLLSKSLWLRVAEVALGLLLIGVGIAKLTNAIPIATKLATKLA